MKKLVIIVAVALGLSGCAVMTAIDNGFGIATGSSVSPQAVIIEVNTFDAIEATATNYLRLPRCNGAALQVCRSPAAMAQIIPAIRSGRLARNQLELFLKQNPGKLGPTGLYNALAGAVTTLQGIVATYNIKN